MKISCEICDFTCVTSAEWIQHLFSECHQTKGQGNFALWTQETATRSILITPVLVDSRSPSPRSCVDKFKSFGLISDCLFNIGKKFVIIQIDDVGAIDYINGKKPFMIDNFPVTIRTLCYLSAEERQKLFINEDSQGKTNIPVIINGNPGTSTRPPTGNVNPFFMSLRKPVPSKAESDATADHIQLLDNTDSEQSTPRKTKRTKTAKNENLTKESPVIPSTSKSQTQKKMDKTISPIVDKISTPKKTKSTSPNKSNNNKSLSPTKSTNGEKEKSPFVLRHEELSLHLRNEKDLGKQFDEFICSVTIGEEDTQIRRQFLQEVLLMLRPMYPACVLYPFGSFVTGLGDIDSDIDIFVDLHGSCMTDWPPMSHFAKTELIRTLQHIFRRTGRFVKVFSITRARVPIIQLEHEESLLSADLSFENLLSVQNSKLISFYTRVHPLVRPLLLVVRYWGKYHGLIGSNNIKNYALVLLVLAFLMRKGIIPSVHLLQTLSPQPFIIDGWDSSFCFDLNVVHASEFGKTRNPTYYSPQGLPSHNQLSPMEELLKLALEFFNWYAGLDYEKLMVCTLLGDFLPREIFTPGYEEELPPEFHRYVIWVKGKEARMRFNSMSALCIQDPFNLGFNVGSCVKDNIFQNFVAACKAASLQVARLLEGNDGNIMHIFSEIDPSLWTRPGKKKRQRNGAGTGGDRQGQAQVAKPTPTTKGPTFQFSEAKNGNHK